MTNKEETLFVITSFISQCHEVFGYVKDLHKGFKIERALALSSEILSIIYNELPSELPECFSTLYIELGNECDEWDSTDFDLVDNALNEAQDFLKQI